VNIIEEFLVKLGFEADEGSFRQFRSALKDAELAVERSVGGMTKSLLGLQGTTLGAFASISAGIVTMADKVAMADQSYRLLGLRFLMTTDTARTLSMTAKALGMDMETLMRAAPWDPELMQRSLALFRDIAEMTGELGPRFEQNMKGIRDIRFEFQRLGVGIEFLKMQFAGDLFEKLHLDAPRIAKFVDEFEAKIPELANKLSDYAIPILKDTWYMFEAIGGAAKQFAVLFSNVVGMLSGDTSLEGTAFSFDKIARSVEHVVHFFSELFQWITLLERALAHFAAAVGSLFERNWSGAASEFKAGLSDVQTLVAQPVVGGTLAGGGIGALAGGLIGSVIPGAGTAAGAAIGGRIGALVGGIVGAHRPEPIPKAETSDVIPLIKSIAEKEGVPTELALAIAQQESGFRQNARSSVGAIGIMQLMPTTARQLGINPYDAQQNIEGGVRYLKRLLDHYSGNQALAAAAYNAGPGRVDKALALGATLPKETLQYVPSVLAREQNFSAYLQRPGEQFAPQVTSREVNQHVAINLGGIYITQPNADARQIQQAVAAGVRDGLRAQTQVDLAQLAPAW
jgi:hypothetical protein